MTNHIIGIDLGTTNSCVGIWKNGKVEIIPNELGERLTPSYISFTNDKRQIGKFAKKNITKNPKNTIYNIKRIIGHNFSDEEISKDIENLSYKIIKSEKNKPLIEIEYKNKKYNFSPEYFSAIILIHLKKIAETYIGEKIKNAIISVPAYFNSAQKEATKIAGEIAGLNILKLIDEPTAAAIAYGFNNKFNEVKNILVFDLGGGTFDVSILKMEKNNFNVLSINGDSHLGGEDFDQKLIDFCIEKFEKENKVLIRNNHKILHRLKINCENAKIELSFQKETNIYIENIINNIDLDIKINRIEFEILCKDLFDKLIKPINDCIKNAKLKKEQIDNVILIGGSSKIPKIKEILSNKFNDKILTSKNINPQEAVCEGVTIQGAILTLKEIKQNIKINNINPISLGINADQNGIKIMSIIIPKNSPLPCKKTNTYVTSEDNQNEILFKIYQGERILSKDNFFLGSFKIVGLRKAKKGDIVFDVTMELDENNILKVTAKECNGQFFKEFKIENVNQLSQDEINWFKEQEFIFKFNDDLYKKNAQSRAKFTKFIHQKRDEFEFFSDEKVRNEIIELLNKAENWILDSNLSSKQIDLKIEELEKKIKNLFKL